MKKRDILLLRSLMQRNSQNQHENIGVLKTVCIGVLDVAFNEDNCRMRKDNSGENFAVIRHIALNLLKKDDSKMSVKAKRHRCAYDDDFLFDLLFMRD